jgi:hypothetical protein
VLGVEYYWQCTFVYPSAFYVAKNYPVLDQQNIQQGISNISAFESDRVAKRRWKLIIACLYFVMLTNDIPKGLNIGIN